MTRRTTAIAAALSLLPLGQPLLLGSTTAVATAAVVLSTQAAHAQSADNYVNKRIGESKRGDLQVEVSKSLPSLMQGMPYSEAHQELISTARGCEGVSEYGYHDGRGGSFGETMMGVRMVRPKCYCSFNKKWVKDAMGYKIYKSWMNECKFQELEKQCHPRKDYGCGSDGRWL